MKVVKEGHRYELEGFDNPENVQIIQFIEKELVTENGKSSFKTINDGTTNEELIKVLINRLTNLNSKLPSRETSMAITKLDESLLWLNKRTNDRKKRNVEGTNLK